MRILRSAVVLAVALVVVPSDLSASVAPSRAPTTPARPDLDEREVYGRLPLHFEANRGQTDAQVRFTARCRGYTAFFTPTETVFALRNGAAAPEVVRMRFARSNRSRWLVGRSEMEGKSSYFIGNDPDRWVTGVPHFERLLVDDLYPGMDLHGRGNEERNAPTATATRAPAVPGGVREAEEAEVEVAAGNGDLSRSNVVAQ